MPNLTLVSAVDTFLGSADQAEMRTNLGLGTLATQAASAVAITGGTFAGLSVQVGFGAGRVSINHDINGVMLGSGSSVIQFYDTYLVRGGAINVLQIGQSSATPAAQCFKGADGSGTNIVGGKLSIAPGRSTGNATPGKLALQGTAVGGSGSTAQTLVDVFTVVNSQYIEIKSGVIIDSDGSGFRFGSTSSSELGFWGASPVAQYSGGAGAAMAGGGSGSAVLEDSTFNGSTGAMAYTINDLVAALKACGIVAL